MKKLPNGRYQVRWREGGRRYGRNFRSKEAALDFEKRKYFELETPAAPTPQTPTMTFKEFAAVWVEDYCKLEKAESQWIDDPSIIKTHLVPAFGGVLLGNLHEGHLTALKKALRAKGRKAKTVNNVVGLAKKMLADAVAWRKRTYLSENPFADVKRLKRQKPEIQYWIAPERDRFLNYCRTARPDLYGIFVVTCHTGLRLGEVLGLTRECLVFERRRIVVKQSYCEKLGRIVPHTKSHELREVPMNPAVEEVLSGSRRLAQSQAVFDLAAQYPHLGRTVGRLAKKAGVKPVNFHALRHTFSACFLLARGSVFVLSKLLGHSDVSITFRNYGHLHSSGLDAATDILLGTRIGHSTECTSGTSDNNTGNLERVTGLEPLVADRVKLRRIG